jgi:signal transduction histidine kinase/DNA-binding response OmpR family regulator/HPt (histidine-containing phosphotransfer) domain-containing protein
MTVGTNRGYRWIALFLLNAAAVAILTLLPNHLRAVAPFVLLSLGVMASAYFGGLVSGFIATAIGLGLEYCLLDQPVATAVTDQAVWLRLLVFLLLGVEISWLGDLLKSERGRAQRQADSLRETEEARVRLLHDLKAEQHLLQTILKHLPAHVVVAEAPSGKILLDNGHMAPTAAGEPAPLPEVVADYATRYDVRRADGTPYPPGDWPLSRSIRAGDIVSGEILRFHCAADHAPVTISINSAPIHNADGTLVAGVAAAFDVTAQVAAEEALRQAHAELECRVEERTAKLLETNRELQAEIAARRLAEEQLRLAKQSAEAATEAKSAFLAVMSHEIRTPLNGVVGMIDLLLGTELDDRQHRYARIAKTSASALLNLINDILDFSKIEANRMELDEVGFDLYDVVEGLVDTFAQRAAQKRLELACHIHPKVPTMVKGDAAKLRQVLTNLIGNAVKFTDRGQVVVEVLLESETADRVTVRFEVSDTGPGIAPESAGRIFQPFSQADASTTRKYGGTGLGLTISRRLAEMMGGRLDLTSEVGQGSTFWCVLPLERYAQPQRPRTSQLPASLRNLRTLVVDNSAVSGEVLTEQLANWGVQVTVAADAPAAVDAAHREAVAGRPFNLTIADKALCHAADGTPLAALLPTAIAPDRPPTPLIVMVSIEEDIPAAELKAMGASAYVMKPVRPSRLLDAIVDAISERPARPGDVAGPAALRAATRPGGRRILLAEDNEINQIVAAEILVTAGYQCDIVANGRQVLDALRDKHYDLILMDCQMPAMDGFEATHAIRHQERGVLIGGSPAAHVPIIALTANAIKEDRDRCLAIGMDGYVTKPINARQLIETVGSFLSPMPHDDGRDQHVPAPAPLPPDDPPPIDHQALLSRCMGNRALVRLVLAKFASDGDGYLARISESVRTGRREDLRRAAHALRGAAANLSADTLAGLAADLESAATARPPSDVADLAAKLEGEIRRCTSHVCRAGLVADREGARGFSPAPAGTEGTN